MGSVSYEDKVAMQRAQELNKMGNPVDVFGALVKPTYESLRGPGGELKSQFQVSAQPDLAGGFAGALRGTGDVQNLRNRATSIGLSPGARLQQQSLQQGAQEQASQGLASAFGRMASRGGLDAGARERLSGQSARGLQQGIQNIGLQTSIEDERQKLGIAQNLPGMQQSQESAILAAQQGDVGRKESAQRTNIGSLLGDVQGKGQFEAGQFAEALKALGAEKQSLAEARKGK